MPLQSAVKKPVKIQFWEWSGDYDEAHRIIHWIEKWGGEARYIDAGFPHHLRRYDEYDNTAEEPEHVGDYAPAYIAIHTLEGWHRADKWDRVVKGVLTPPSAPDFFPVKPEAFALSYDIVES